MKAPVSALRALKRYCPSGNSDNTSGMDTSEFSGSLVSKNPSVSPKPARFPLAFTSRIEPLGPVTLRLFQGSPSTKN
tara:strand:+ start:2411 stop:2641 length:231 start_codon:yes stop_codon:yes gene_type:complete